MRSDHCQFLRAQQPTRPPYASEARHASAGARAERITGGAGRTTFGQLLETFVFQELRRQTSWHEREIRFHRFRDKDLVEVGIVLDGGSRGIADVDV
jgi:hypothetical protein